MRVKRLRKLSKFLPFSLMEGHVVFLSVGQGRCVGDGAQAVRSLC